MSDQRRYRLRRTMAGLALATVVLLIVVLAKWIGGDPATPTRSDAGSGAAAAASSGRSSSEPRPSASKSGPTSKATAKPSAEPTSVPAKGSGKLTAVPVPDADSARGGRQVRFSVQVEGGLGVDAADFARSVRTILTDERGWEPVDDVHFVAVTPDELAAGNPVDIRITLASPDLTDELCAPLRTLGEVSCNQNGRAVINAKRWVAGVKYYDDLSLYRTYLINHEVGHGLGHSHSGCPSPGAKAPIMVQQSLGLQGCTAWPYPKGA